MSDVKLKFPIETEGRTVEVVTLRRPKVRDMLSAEKASGSPAEQEIKMFSSLSELPPDAIEQLDMADYKQLQEAYKSFLS